MASKYIQGKNAIIKLLQVIESKILTPPRICFFNFGEQVDYMVCLAKIVLNIVVVCLVAELAKFVLEAPLCSNKQWTLPSIFILQSPQSLSEHV